MLRGMTKEGDGAAAVAVAVAAGEAPLGGWGGGGVAGRKLPPPEM